MGKKLIIGALVAFALGAEGSAAGAVEASVAESPAVIVTPNAVALGTIAGDTIEPGAELEFSVDRVSGKVRGPYAAPLVITQAPTEGTGLVITQAPTAVVAPDTPFCLPPSYIDSSGGCVHVTPYVPPTFDPLGLSPTGQSGASVWSLPDGWTYEQTPIQ